MCARALCFLLLLTSGCDRAQIITREDAGTRRGAYWPDRPSAADGSGEDRLYVLRDPVISQQPDRWRSIGWDLDDHCTVPIAEDAGALPDGGYSWEAWDLECTPRRPTRTGPIPDGDMCRDNAFGAYVTLALATLPGDVQAEASQAMAAGRYGLLVRVRGYSGEPDDPAVEVDVFPTVYGMPRGGRRGDVLRWDGTDQFFLAREGFSSIDDEQAVIRDPQAYVARGILVMRLPTRADFDFASMDSLLRVRITQATITARIDADPTRPLTTVTLAGRWPLNDVLEQLPWLGLCAGDPRDEVVIDLLREGLESGADVLAEPPDPSAPLVPCEALSLGVTFTGQPGTIGGIVPFERPSGVCPGAM